MLALPPPGWPKMPPSLVHILVIIGVALTIVGVIVAIYGLWPALPNPKLPVLGMSLSALLFGACAVWFWIIPEKLFSIDDIPKPLKRMIAYSSLDLIIPWDGKVPLFHGYNIRVNNVSDDTITSRIMFVRANVDDEMVMSVTESAAPVIIPQTQGITFQTQRDGGDAPISIDAKAITVEFEVDYNTIPETGIRRSYRKITYPLDWANGKNNSPRFEPHTVDEWER
jgi:hypothetical protein